MSKPEETSILFDHGQAFMGAWSRRLAELVSDQGESLLQASDSKVPPLCVSTFLQIEKSGSTTIAALSRDLGLSHQLVKQRTSKLEALNLIQTIPSDTDKRKKMLALSPEASPEVEKLHYVCAQASAAFSDMYDEIGCALMPILHAAIAALERKPLKDRSQKQQSK